MKPTIIAIDLAKDIFQVCTYNPNTGKVVRNKAVSRSKLFDHVMQQKQGVVAMEACTSAHYWGRRFRDELGYQVKLISPQHVAQLRRGVKNDSNDAVAIAEAVMRPEMVFVEIKTTEQLDLQAQHRIRQMLDRDRTALNNQIRGFLAENGIFIHKSVTQFRRSIPEVLEDGSNHLSARMRAIICRLYERYQELDNELAAITAELTRTSRKEEPCQRLQEMRGIGPMTATALYAKLGNARHFKNGRQAAANLGVVPQHWNSGGKTQLGSITKKGDPYLRKLLVQGANSVISSLGKKDDPYSNWLRALVERVGRQRAAVAVANKNVRIAWAILSRNESYNPKLASSLGNA